MSMLGNLHTVIAAQVIALQPGAAAAVTTTAPAGGVTAGEILAPIAILMLAVVAGIGTMLLLPSRREAAIRNVGGVILLAAALILAATLVRLGQAAAGGGMGVYFWVFAAVSLFGAVRVITHARPVYAALYFVLTVFATAGLFVLLWAEFMAAALVLIYAGAILITYVFVIMLAASAETPGATVGGKSGTDVLTEYDQVSRDPLIASAVGFALMGVLLFVVFDRAGTMTKAPAGAAPAIAVVGNTQELGVYLFQDHMVNLELAGLILTVSMVGAIVIARRRVFLPENELAPPVAPERGARATETYVAPMTPVDDNPHSIPVYGTTDGRQKAYPET